MVRRKSFIIIAVFCLLFSVFVPVEVCSAEQETFHVFPDYPPYDTIQKAIDAAKEGDIIYVLATYTAMIDFRKFLYSKGFIRKLW